MAGVELASVIRQLRAELNEALADAEGERLRFELGPVEMSLDRDGGPGGRAGSKDPLLGHRGRRGCQVVARAVQEIKLVLSPVDTQAPVGPGGKAAAPLITGSAVEGER